MSKEYRYPVGHENDQTEDTAMGDIEKGKRGAAARAHATRGRARVLSPDRTVYDRKEGDGIDQDEVMPLPAERVKVMCLTEGESKDTTLVILEDGRRLWLPSVVYRRVNDSGFTHGIDWARAHPDDD